MRTKASAGLERLVSGGGGLKEEAYVNLSRGGDSWLLLKKKGSYFMSSSLNSSLFYSFLKESKFCPKNRLATSELLKILCG